MIHKARAVMASAADRDGWVTRQMAGPLERQGDALVVARLQHVGGRAARARLLVPALRRVPGVNQDAAHAVREVIAGVGGEDKGQKPEARGSCIRHSHRIERMWRKVQGRTSDADVS